ncbi:uncharacterized protein LOC125485855 isoform X3 [Rhincodon typus]|uniref:uncharacterized protein LOC125485855 isoform X3 n=1 Tax=Rhincodon typus TaxID=259920 RepID=UPI002030C56D|nr:uncharacterized protein LOC125485855 isoform X3 [Rhincodon typus]
MQLWLALEGVAAVRQCKTEGAICVKGERIRFRMMSDIWEMCYQNVILLSKRPSLYHPKLTIWTSPKKTKISKSKSGTRTGGKCFKLQPVYTQAQLERTTFQQDSAIGGYCWTARTLIKSHSYIQLCQGSV